MSLPLIIETKIRVLHIKVGPTKFYISNFIFTISNLHLLIRDQPSVKTMAKR